jgi:alkylation response protein AidB-like acyl-CoA dehydrogenase
MDFGLNEQQEMLAQTARDFLRAESAPAFVRRVGEDALGSSPELNRKLAEHGWLGIMIPEAQGGLGWVDS